MLRLMQTHSPPFWVNTLYLPSVASFPFLPSLFLSPFFLFSCSVDRRSSSLGAYYRCCRQFSLAAGTRAHQVQTGSHCLQCRSLYDTAPQYLSDRLQYVADLPTRRRGRLRSSTSSLLDICPSRLVTVGDRCFAAAGPRLWNSLPADVQSAPSLTTFRQKLKTHLFRQSSPDIVF